MWDPDQTPAQDKRLLGKLILLMYIRPCRWLENHRQTSSELFIFLSAFLVAALGALLATIIGSVPLLVVLIIMILYWILLLSTLEHLRKTSKRRFREWFDSQ